MKIIKIDGENYHIFWTTLGIFMKFLGNMWLIITLKVTKNQGFALSLVDTFLEKQQGVQTDPAPSLLRVKRI